jgi:hypothetical protein
MDDASPRFRQDLEASATEADGVACVDVSDRRTGTSFRFYDFEYQLALQFNGQPVRDVIAWASETFGADLTVEGINEFAGRLSELGFLDTAGAVALPAAGDATPAPGTRPEGLESAEAEWMTTEGAKTATFVPDATMFDSPGELTPVAPDLPTLEAEAEADAAGSIDVTTDEATPAPDNAKPAEAPAPAPRLFDLLAPVAPKTAKPGNDVLVPPVAPALAAPPAAKPASSWALELEGNLQGSADRSGAPAPAPAPVARMDVPDLKTPPPLSTTPPSMTVTPPPVLKPPAGVAPPGPLTGIAPPGLPERRQPPAPEAVLMTAFSQEAAGSGGKAKKNSNARVIAIVILLLAIAGIGYAAWTYERAHRLPQAVRVRVISPRPTATYLWFSGAGTVTDHEARTLAFESAGTLAELLPSGTAFGTDDILGRLRGAQPIEALLGRHRARVAFYQQMRDSMRAASNQVELRQAEIKLAEKQRLVDEGMASLAKLVIRATEPGEIVATLAKVGTPIAARTPLVRVKGRMLHGEFDLAPEEIADAAALGFCRVEVVGLGPRASNAEPAAGAQTAADVGSPEAQSAPRFVDCTIEKSKRSAGKKLRVTLPDNLGLVPGQPLRLARQRYDAVFPLPGAAVGGDAGKGGRSIWIAGAAGTAERRAVTVADRAPVAEGARMDAPEDVLVTGGLRVGDEVIVDAPADLRAGVPLIVER